MSNALVFAPRQRQTGGRSNAPVTPDLDRADAAALAVVAKALADPTRLRILDALRKASPEAICQCELVPLFEMSQPALAKHLRVLVTAGVVGSERRGAWTYYFLPAASPVGELARWLA
jgi:ArsR family transcriptional regulator